MGLVLLEEKWSDKRVLDHICRQTITSNRNPQHDVSWTRQRWESGHILASAVTPGVWLQEGVLSRVLHSPYNTLPQTIPQSGGWLQGIQQICDKS